MVFTVQAKFAEFVGYRKVKQLGTNLVVSIIARVIASCVDVPSQQRQQLEDLRGFEVCGGRIFAEHTFLLL